MERGTSQEGMGELLPSCVPQCCTVTWFLQETLLQEEALKGVPVLVFANKQDLLNAKGPAEVRAHCVAHCR